MMNVLMPLIKILLSTELTPDEKEEVAVALDKLFDGGEHIEQEPEQKEIGLNISCRLVQRGE